MHRLLVLSLGFLVLGTGCSKYSLVSLYDGTWTGTATDAAGLAAPVTAAFTFTEGEGDGKFSGTMTYEGYNYAVISAASDEESGTVNLYYPELAWRLNLTQITVEEETSMKGNFAKAMCPEDTASVDPLCSVTGTFTMEKQ